MFLLVVFGVWFYLLGCVECVIIVIGNVVIVGWWILICIVFYFGKLCGGGV